MRYCCVPKCRGGHAKGPSVAMFGFPPKTSELYEKWLKNIPRNQWSPKKSNSICELHFLPNDVIWVDHFKCNDGQVIELPRKVPKLREGAIPTIFSDIEGPLTKRKRTSIAEKIQAAQEKELAANNIENFGIFQKEVKVKVTAYNKQNRLQWQVVRQDNLVTIYKLSVTDVPTITHALKVNSNMQAALYSYGIAQSAQVLEDFLENGLYLRTWSQLEKIMSLSINDVVQPSINYGSKLANIERELLEALKLAPNLDIKYLSFLIEQFSALQKQKKTYSSNFLRFAFQLYSMSPDVYTYLKNEGMFLLPHPRTLKIFASGE